MFYNGHFNMYPNCRLQNRSKSSKVIQFRGLSTVKSNDFKWCNFQEILVITRLVSDELNKSEPVLVIPDFSISDELFWIMRGQVTHNYPIFSNFGQYDFAYVTVSYVINGTLIFILYFSLLKRFRFRIRYIRYTKKIAICRNRT